MEIVIYVYEGLTALDAIGPYEVLSRLPKARIRFVAEQAGDVTTDTGFLRIGAEAGIDEVEHADILVVPGATVGFLRQTKKPHVLDWIRRMHETTSWTTSVCTGSIILAATGLLDGLRATSHWGAIDLLRDYGAVPTPERYIREGKIVTAQGVSAGIDMALYLAREIAGTKHAEATQLGIEYLPQPPVNSGPFTKARPETIRAARWILAHDARRDLSVADAVRHAGPLLRMGRG
ncbi:MAG: DJ-1/PfpI family protein [Bacteroidota bacterium]